MPVYQELVLESVCARVSSFGDDLALSPFGDTSTFASHGIRTVRNSGLATGRIAARAALRGLSCPHESADELILYLRRDVVRVYARRA